MGAASPCLPPPCCMVEPGELNSLNVLGRFFPYELKFAFPHGIPFTLTDRRAEDAPVRPLPSLAAAVMRAGPVS